MDTNLGDNVVAGLAQSYQVVAKRHIHPWYSWAILAIVIGFTVGVAYVANQGAELTSSSAATQGHQWVVPENADGFFVSFIKNLFK